MTKKTSNNQPAKGPDTANDSAPSRRPAQESYRDLNKEIKSNTVKNSMPPPPNPKKK